MNTKQYKRHLKAELLKYTVKLLFTFNRQRRKWIHEKRADINRKLFSLYMMERATKHKN